MTNMPGISIWFGRLLIVLGIAGYAYGLANGNASLTAMIPGAFGLVLMILGHAAAASDSMRKHLMHVAVLVGILGFIIPAVRIISKLGEFSVSAAFVSQLLMSLISLVFVILCVRSFIAARRG